MSLTISLYPIYCFVGIFHYLLSYYLLNIFLNLLTNYYMLLILTEYF